MKLVRVTIFFMKVLEQETIGRHITKVHQDFYHSFIHLLLKPDIYNLHNSLYYEYCRHE